jgi:trimethylamine:corrinoid methyltransferase-like protein
MEQRAADMVDKILAAHDVAPLSEDVQQKIHAIVEREQAWIDSKKK